MASSQSRILKLIRSNCNSQSVVRHFSSVRKPTSFSPKFNANSEEDEARKPQKNPPQPIPNRPLRGERRERPLNQSQSKSQSQSQSSPSPRGARNVRLNESIDDNFLDKFKLRHNKNKDNEIPFPNNPSPPPAAENNDNNETEDQKSNSPPEADEIFKKMKETGLIPNAVAMLDGLCKDGHVQEAMKLFGLMREKGTMPEVVVYTAVVDGFCKAQKMDDAKRIFRKMIDNGITPNAFSYGILIQGLCKCNSLDDAVDFSIQMLEAGYSPNLTTFVGLVDGLGREKGVEEAHTVIEAFRKKGFVVNDKAIRDFFDKNAPFSSSVWEAVFGRKPSEKPF